MENHRSKIEDYGVVMEGMGLSPVAARVFVYLLFSQQDQATFEDMVSYFKVSKSAISNALKFLLAVNMIESKTVGGQRKRYFHINFKKMLDQQEMTSRFKNYCLMLDDIRASRGLEDEFAQELNNVSSLYKMMIVEFPIILERWRQIKMHNNKAV
ncbi:GbsR/MarR family transcriptional regulator [Dyadobacter arcticus]|uniref:DNA-binding transcriptional regulator GbsR (MarR family) n=1 Tax=Dyadobacter arcticus TaxID=1078754 RepID=A0ABX0UT36_9BACT|nr:helix-turn-helix domain-containing protein [Dyadobacter arcticus]NIJ56131.1 DNA-binding transcriptional regulator GbsR (MarR family) [Dyadobacter arcticus]